MAKEYTERFKDFQIRDCVYLGEPPADDKYKYDVVKWNKYDKPVEMTDLKTGKKKDVYESCYTVGTLIYNPKEPCFEFKSCGLRWLEAFPDEEVNEWIIRWCRYKLWEITREEDDY